MGKKHTHLPPSFLYIKYNYILLSKNFLAHTSYAKET